MFNQIFGSWTIDTGLVPDVAIIWHLSAAIRIRIGCRQARRQFINEVLFAIRSRCKLILSQFDYWPSARYKSLHMPPQHSYRVMCRSNNSFGFRAKRKFHWLWIAMKTASEMIPWMSAATASRLAYLTGASIYGRINTSHAHGCHFECNLYEWYIWPHWDVVHTYWLLVRKQLYVLMTTCNQWSCLLIYTIQICRFPFTSQIFIYVPNIMYWDFSWT